MTVWPQWPHIVGHHFRTRLLYSSRQSRFFLPHPDNANSISKPHIKSTLSLLRYNFKFRMPPLLPSLWTAVFHFKI